MLLLDLQGTEVNPALIKLLIEKHRPKRMEMLEAYQRYKAKQVPIMTRKLGELEDTKINNKINVDTYSLIIDQKVGYMMGKPVSFSYNTDEENGNEVIRERAMAEIDDFMRRNSFHDVAVRTCLMASICSYGALLMYVCPEGKERAKSVLPFDVAFISPDGEKVTHALRYYTINRFIDGQIKAVERAEFYDDRFIYLYEKDANSGEYILLEEPKEHLFDYVPLLCFPNNDEWQGDAQNALELIDAYDRTVSDVNSEIEQFRLAYLLITGARLEDDALEKLKQTGVLELPDGNSVNAQFLTKEMATEFIEKHLDRLEEDLWNVVGGINFKDRYFGGNHTGPALRYKLQNLENKASTTEAKMKKGFREMFQVLASAWRKKNIILDYLDVDMAFSRTFPKHILDEAQANSMLVGTISDRTRLAQLSFIENPDDELWLMKQEREEKAKRMEDMYPFASEDEDEDDPKDESA
ncbi:phage portal protein [Aneurinibacillus migulanus]|uniref:Phage portal protein, SPP1 family n=1 Tax=Aneurinibacillus migulanus TaxID=47500 RepID=A0A0M0G3T2_ANEMI|nr:phage portal protein [Aneurinibacillus migulanus]KON84272.1 hypothetical protein AF333_30530 [Aneurinibacillus migulanus]MED0893820.1 phage portal protein [Aneurinibacillus migulanus]MED1614499.1 phage portal protein [Aneurinibacillus migulanus]SDI83788.1 phage portal protein, SPP1 family [Aneurinibacillus migulanus]GED17348.1 portal protein [Aneurinibacillus migulanus]